MQNLTKEDRAKDIQESIGRILYEDWDPIGVKGSAPRSEYDSYIGGVYRILAGSHSENELVDFLLNVEVDTMGLGLTPRLHETLKPVVEKLLALDVKLYARH